MSRKRAAASRREDNLRRRGTVEGRSLRLCFRSGEEGVDGEIGGRRKKLMGWAGLGWAGLDGDLLPRIWALSH